jgi:hypothetical protein
MSTEFTGQIHEVICNADSALPPGTLASPRPADRPREIPAPGEETGPFFHEFTSTAADDPPPGTKASQRPPGRDRLSDEDVAGPSPTDRPK